MTQDLPLGDELSDGVHEEEGQLPAKPFIVTTRYAGNGWGSCKRFFSLIQHVFRVKNLFFTFRHLISIALNEFFIHFPSTRFPYQIFLASGTDWLSGLGLGSQVGSTTDHL